ncbi:hypothetical protein Taro_048578 [Colocasia esculenta]|uniref:Peptidase S1 domain-containing protein n=1 Tax=Colocasia esculenta TaxID=4460 RepID=A0A843X8H9_COLES|nr:hypothetical protein [Colocasia esculenta]
MVEHKKKRGRPRNSKVADPQTTGIPGAPSSAASPMDDGEPAETSSPSPHRRGRRRKSLAEGDDGGIKEVSGRARRAKRAQPHLGAKKGPASPLRSSLPVVNNGGECCDQVVMAEQPPRWEEVVRVVPSMDAVVKVFCVHTEPNFSLPWQRKRQYSSSSSGFIIAGRRVLTNAHCVEHYTQVKLKKRGSDTKYVATVLAIGTECDIGVNVWSQRRRPGRAGPYRGALGGRDKGRCRDLVSRRDRVVVATRCPVASGFVSRRPSPSRYYRDGLWGRDSSCGRLGCFRGPVVCRRVPQDRLCPQDLLVGNAAGCLPAFSDRSQRFGVVLVVLPRLFARCLALEGLPHSEVVSVAWDPHPREPVEGGLGRRGVRSAFLAHTRQSLVSLPLFALVPEPRGGVRREAAAWPGCGVACVVCSVAALSRPCAGEEAGARLASRACGLRVPLLAASGGGLVAVVVTAFSSRRFQVFLVARACTVVIAWLCLVSMGVVARDGTGVCSFPTWRCVRGPGWFCLCTEHCFRFVPNSVGFCGSRVFLAALAGEGLVIPTGPCSRGSPPYFLQLGARRRGSSVSDGLRRRLWRRVVVSNSESECFELLYPSELRVVFCKSSGYAP